MRQLATLMGLRWCAIVPLLLAGWEAGPTGALAQSAGPDPPATVVAGDNSALDVLGAVAGATPLATTMALNAAFSYAAKAGYQTVNLAANTTYNIASTGDLAEDGQPTALKIGGASGLTLDCHGATLVLNTAGRNTFAKSLWVSGGNKIRVRGCRFDWNQLPYTQATLSAINPTSADFTIDPAYPVAGWTTVQQIEEFTPSVSADAPAAWKQTVFWWSGGDRILTGLGGNLYRVDLSGDLSSLALLTVGHAYLIEAQNYNAEALWAYNVDDLTFDDVQCYAAAGECIRTWGGRDLRFVNGTGSKLLPGSTRWRSTTSSAIFPGFARGPMVIDTPIAQSAGDDGVDVYGLLYGVTRVTDRRHFILSTIQPPGNQPRVNDVLQFEDPTGAVRGTAVVAAVSGADPGPYSITTAADAPAGLSPAWAVSDLSAVPTKLTVTNGRFEHIRGFGVRSNAQANLIADNHFNFVTQSAVFIGSNKALFADGPVAQKISILNNLSENNNRFPGGIIPTIPYPADFVVEAYGFDGSTVAPAGTISDVVISGNSCRSTPYMCVFVAGADRVAITGNTFRDWGLAGHAGRFFGLGAAAVGLYNVTNAQIDPNVYLSPGLHVGRGGTTTR